MKILIMMSLAKSFWRQLVISFLLDPPGGYANSYTDIKFKILTEKICDVLEAELWNNDAQLQIFAVINGVIQNEIVAVFKDTNKAEGYFNLFNDDKMNASIANLSEIVIECRCKLVINGEKHDHKQSVVFYNQSQSLDWNIAPFDIKVMSPIIDLQNRQPLKIQVHSDVEKRYELAVMSDHQKEKCVFEIVTKAGKLDIHLPSEILWSDLNLHKHIRPSYSLYWVKFEGVSYKKFMNRRYIPLSNTAIKFNGTLSLGYQNRLGPTKSALPPEFVLSDRYFVHTWKSFSSLGAISDNFGSKRLNCFSRFFYEAQDLRNLDASVVLPFGNLKQEVKQSIREHDYKHRPKITSYAKAEKWQFLSVFNHITTSSYSAEQRETSQKSNTKTGGCGCARKNNVNK